MSGILRVTDGIRTVTMLANLAGIFVEDWRPQSSQSKGGGVWSESPFINGRQLVVDSRMNITDTFEFKLHDGDQDSAIRDIKLLTTLLEDAVSYWTDDWQSGSFALPVWIEYRGDCETNTSYAYIYDYSIPEIDNPHNNPFRRGTADEMTLIVEHGEWRNSKPKETVDTNIFAGQLLTVAGIGDVYYGTTESIKSTVSPYHFSTLKYVNSNISHVYNYDAGTAAYSANLLNTGGAVNLYNLPVQVNDALYCGSCVDDIPFDSLLLLLSQLGDGTVTLQLEYWNGAAWAAVSASPEFAPSGIFVGPTTGYYSMTWRRISDWATTNVNGQIGYWIRIRVSVVTVAPTQIPIHNGTVLPIASIQWPWINIADDDLPGDIDASIKYYLTQIAHDNTVVPNSGQCNRIIIGSRSRGVTPDSGNDYFTSYLNCNYNKTGVTVGGTGASNTDSISPSGYVRNMTVIGATTDYVIASWTITSGAESWRGDYRVFVRYRYNSGASAALRLSSFPNSARTNATTTSTQYTNVGTGAEKYVLDLGTIRIDTFGEDTMQYLQLYLLADTSGAANIDVIDIALVPIDEFVFEIASESLSDYGSRSFVHDSTTEKQSSFTRMIGSGSIPLAFGAVYENCITKVLGKMRLKRNKDQRLFAFGWYEDTSTGESFAILDGSFVNKLETVSHYIFARGDA